MGYRLFRSVSLRLSHTNPLIRNALRRLTMTYADYVAHAKSRGFQPLSERAFTALRKAGFNPITNTWEN